MGAGADRLSVYFDDLMQSNLQMQMWYCGHYHMDRQLTERFRVLYDDIVRIE